MLKYLEYLILFKRSESAVCQDGERLEYKMIKLT